ncbi:hypothetical protein BpHYR1_042639 [Brachionus plicatilis]|uniref:Uncharacterized protein n=1 Tax=Brachionus plicatilis TaxID=10195 RepID=A0A3M7T877_BRAPC|nr:hypothetical protein BpHYR1_042639 [Brachionus plicatilis]
MKNFNSLRIPGKLDFYLNFEFVSKSFLVLRFNILGLDDYFRNISVFNSNFMAFCIKQACGDRLLRKSSMLDALQWMVSVAVLDTWSGLNNLTTLRLVSNFVELVYDELMNSNMFITLTQFDINVFQYTNY